MSDLVVVAFPGDPDGAQRASAKLQELGDSGAITPDDAVLVEVDSDGRMVLNQAFPLAEEGALDGALLGGALGFMLTIPFGPVGPLVLLVASLAGVGVGAATGGWIGHHRDYGIPDAFAEQLGDSMPPNSSALFVMVPADQCAAASELFGDLGGRVHAAKLDDAGEAELAATMERAHGRSAGSSDS